IYALEIGQQFIMSRTYDTVLVIGAEKLSSIVDWTDRNTCVLFGDGSGAAVLQSRPNAHGLLTACMGADGNKADLLSMPGGGCRCPATTESVSSRLHFLRMEGRETFKNAVNAMYTAAQESLRRCELDVSRIKCVIPPGQPAHYRGRGGAPGSTPRADLRQSRQIRQHIRRIGRDCTGRSGGERAHSARRPDSVDGLWRGFDLGCCRHRVVSHFVDGRASCDTLSEPNDEHMSTSKFDTSGVFQPVTIKSDRTTLNLPQAAVRIRKNGIEFRSPTPIPPWTEMTVTLESSRESSKVNCTG